MTESLSVLLLQPPAIKPAGPPLGLAVLLGYLHRQGVESQALDANLGAYRYLLQPERLAAMVQPTATTSLRRAIKNTERSWTLLTSPAASRSFARYQTAVHHLNTALGVYRGMNGDERLTLGDYRHGGRSEFSLNDLQQFADAEASTLFGSYFAEELLPKVVACKPSLVALSINYRHQLLPAFELAGMLRRALPGVKLVAGGGMLTSWRAELEKSGDVLLPFDHLVFGPGEEALLRLAREGVDDFFLEGSTCLSFTPNFSGLVPGDYASPEPVLPVTASRGCYWKGCLFCPEAVAPTHTYRSCAPAEVPDLLLTLARQWQVRHFHFTDNALPMPVLNALAARRDDLAGMSWYGFVRFEEALTDIQLVDQLATAGCRMLQLGLESGSQTVLDKLGKGTAVTTAAAVLSALHRAGIGTYVYVMFGIPDETEEDRRATLRFLETHANAIGYLNLAIMNLPHQSELAAGRDASVQAEGERGLYLTGAAEQQRRTDARRFIQQELLASPAIRAIVNRTPPLFTSDHAFFFDPQAM
ncbi:radical SAM protein [Syntrophotalea acetylenivorans]|uniref:Radical SAM protein n=1 Tax=Syntrophotalea acetylenivorans TaxID=1842532 RepID=A0A1L3GSS4_9BACT|nr:radical SAM protein [Syntrophotalea acetylenivorans]APG28728.1 radical SAM protein [Syntrophotalea acetylenivorans]